MHLALRHLVAALALVVAAAALPSCSAGDGAPLDAGSAGTGGAGGQPGGAGGGSGSGSSGGSGGSAGGGGSGGELAWLRGSGWAPATTLRADGYCEASTTTSRLAADELRWESCGPGCSWTLPTLLLGEKSYHAALGRGGGGAFVAVTQGQWIDDEAVEVRRVIDLSAGTDVGAVQLRSRRSEYKLCGLNFDPSAPWSNSILTDDIPEVTYHEHPVALGAASWAWMTPSYDFRPFLACELVNWTAPEGVRRAAMCPASLSVTSADTLNFTKVADGEMLSVAGGPWGLAWAERTRAGGSLIKRSTDTGLTTVAEIETRACMIGIAAELLGGVAAPAPEGMSCGKALPGQRFFWITDSESGDLPVVHWSEPLEGEVVPYHFGASDRYLAGIFGTKTDPAFAIVARLSDGATLRLTAREGFQFFDAVTVDGDTLYLVEVSTEPGEFTTMQRLLRVDLTKWDTLKLDGSLDQ